MKLNIIVDSAGNVIGAAHVAAPLKGAKAPAIEAGIIPAPGQSVHEVEVPAEVARLEGPELLKRLTEEKSLKKTLSTLVTAGQG
jgi:hypothetical protein